jgi:type VI protein secretion system component Hcp
MLHFARRAVPFTAAALLAACSFSSATTPFSAPRAPLSTGAADAHANRTNVIYSSRVTFAGPGGRHYTGDAVVFPKGLFPHVHVTTEAGSLGYFLAVAGLQGAVTTQGYRQWIGVDSFSIGYGPGAAGTKRPVTELTFTKGPDVASAGLFGAVFTNDPFTGPIQPGASGGMELDVAQVQDGTDKVQKTMYFTFTKPLATSFTNDFTGGLPTETVSIAYVTAKFCVIPYNAAGQPQTAVCNVWTPSE